MTQPPLRPSDRLGATWIVVGVAYAPFQAAW
jgi:hypothetical protein